MQTQTQTTEQAQATPTKPSAPAVAPILCADCKAKGTETEATHNRTRNGYTFNHYTRPLCDACKIESDEKNRAEYEARRAVEIAEAQAKRAAHNVLCEQIAKALSEINGEQWQAQPWKNADGESYGNGVSIYRGETAPASNWNSTPQSVPSVSVRYDNNKPDRVEFSGSFSGCHDYLPHASKSPSGSASTNKKPEQIARDIARKILPDYLPLFEIAQERYNATLEREDTAKTAAQKIAAASAGKLANDTNTDSTRPITERRLYLNKAGFYGNWRVNAQTVDIEIRSVSHEQAEQVAQLLASWKEAK